MRIVLAGPDPEADGLSAFTREDLVRMCETRFGKTFHPSSMGRLLRRLGFSRQKARPSHPQKDPAAAEALLPASPGTGSWLRRGGLSRYAPTPGFHKSMLRRGGITHQKSRMRESCKSGSVGEAAGDRRFYPTAGYSPRPQFIPGSVQPGQQRSKFCASRDNTRHPAHLRGTPRGLPRHAMAQSYLAV
jgi:hypothetical protein